MASQLDDLAKKQTIIGQEIQIIIKKHKKESDDAKNVKYYESILQQLYNQWYVFELNDNTIRALPDLEKGHEYFSKDYYHSIKNIVEEYRDLFEERIKGFQVQQQIDQHESNSDKANEQEKDPAAQKTNKAIEDKHNTIAKDETSESSTSQRLDILKQIRRQRGVIQSLLRLINSLENIENVKHPKSFYEIKIQSINRYWSQVEDINNTVWELADDPAQFGYDNQEYVQLEERVQEHLIQLSTKLNEVPGSINIANPQLPSITLPSLELPKITLPKFDGDYSKWRQFFDLFSQMVHNQPISNCQKMWYLKTNIVGEAEKLLRHLTLSEENYVSAWKMLQDRYENPRLLAASLINKLLNQPCLATDYTSATSIKTMHDTTQECMMGLENIGVSTVNWDPLLLHILLKKVDRITHTLYEQSLANPKALQSMKDFLTFLEIRFQSLEALGNKGKKPDEASKKQGFMRSSSSLASVIAPNPKCTICSGSHPLYQCQAFLKLTPRARLNIVYKHNICPNCLKTGHYASNCTLRGCKKCTKKHNTLLHLEPISKREFTTKAIMTESYNPNLIPATSMNSNEQTATLTTSIESGHRKAVLLGTSRVKLIMANGNELECRAILDSGSQVNIVSERIAKKLGVIPSHALTYIQGIGQGKQQTQKRVNFMLQSRINAFSTRIEAFVLDKIISSQPSQLLDISQWNIPHNIQLADPAFYRPDRIDLLLGAEHFFQLLATGMMKLGKNLPTLQNTVFGWIVSGEINHASSSAAACGICIEEDINKSIERFWEIEEVDGLRENKLSIAQKQCELHFTQTTRRDNTGRFEVSLPFNGDPETLGQSKDIALRRFMSLERKLAQHSDLRQQYIEFMNEFINLGHMEEIDIKTVISPHYFLPHHSVLKPDSSTTKLRVVFDASAKTSTNISLNDLLHTGPTLQEDLFSILLRFRLPRFVFTADIEKMYRQITLQENDRKYHIIWWRSNPKQPLKCYRLRTVTYGTSSAPYLAIKCLQRLAQEEGSKYPIGAEILQRDFYVDDVMTGADNLSQARHMQSQLNSILKEAGFYLRKWCANHPQLLRGIPSADQEVQLDFTDNKDSSIKTLGLIWTPKSDQFGIKSNPSPNIKVTKRTVASDIARLFDPLGIVAPVIITAKMFLQQLWELKLDWDDALPVEYHTRWMEFRNSLPTLNKIKIPRHVFANEIAGNKQFHVFCDASEKAYGAAIYVRSTIHEGRVIVRLLCSKSKVAPTKRLTLPRLELCAAKLAAELSDRVKKCLKLEDTITHFWTDSEIVLAWINSSSRNLQTFEGNRVATIQRLSLTQQWRHVKSKENPADPLSRGVPPEKLSSCNLWFYGPTYLHGKEEGWPSPYKQNIQCKEKNAYALTVSPTTREDFGGHFICRIQHNNSFRRLQRIVGYMLRFTKLIRKKNNMSSRRPVLTVEELDEALGIIVREMQETEFKEDIRDLSRFRDVSKSSPLSTLAPFLDGQHILRVGGRLKASEQSYDSKHQMLLPYSHKFTKFLMTAIHLENHHVGPQGLLNITRQRFWPIKGKNIARSIVQHCVRCNRSKPKLLSQMMGNLPVDRVHPARPFINSGVDFCGPIWIHYKTRGKRPQKAYIAVFCCFATKAVHLEIVSDLTTDAFIGALKRFIGRRGQCRNLYCDNATNFVGAKNQLAELQNSIYSSEGDEKISYVCSQKGIDFHFIPPRSPHFGGLWEAAVKSAKQLLVRTVYSASLTYEELETVIIEIEAILNSRPLTPMSSNPNDLTALTPGHFLVGEPLITTIDSRAEPVKASLLTRWKLVSHLKHEFWKRWSTEYLNELQYRFKWKQRFPNIKPGEIVVIKEENVPVMKWPLGRIIEVHKGEDGCVRVVDVRTATGVFRRPIHKLAPLQCEDVIDESSEKENTCVPITESEKDLTKRNHEDSNVHSPIHERPAKRIRKSMASSILTVLMACLILPIIKSEPIAITQFDNKVGFYFENIGTTKLITSEWTILAFLDLKPFRMEVDTIKTGTSSLQYLCNQMPRKTDCQPIVDQFQNIKEKMIDDNEWLLPQKLAKQSNRKTINPIADKINSVLDILDEQDAEEMFRTINSIKENEDQLEPLLKNRTSVVDSTINIQINHEAIKRRFENLKNQLSNIYMHQRDMKEQDRQTRIQQQFIWLTIKMTLCTNNLHRMQSAIDNIITDTNHGRISPLLLSSNQLKKEFNTIRCLLPSTLKLPISQDNVLEMYRLMTIKSRIINDYIIFQLKFPLVIGEHFELLKVVPIPIWINDSLMAIKNHASFLAVTSHRDYYYPIADKELSSCRAMEGNNYVCEQIRPIYRKGASICSCEIQILNNLQSPESCKLIELMYQESWIQLSDSNQWIFSLKNNISINVVCTNDTFTTILHGSGILKIQQKCIMKEESFIIHGHLIDNKSHKTTIFHPDINTKHTDQEELHKLTQLPNQTKESFKNITHYIAISYITLSITLILILCLIWKFKSAIFRCHSDKSQAASGRQSIAVNYEINV